MNTTTAIVKRIESKSCRRVKVGDRIAHTNGDSDLFQPTCPECGWEGGVYPNRQVEYQRLAQRDADEHTCASYAALRGLLYGKSAS